RAVHVVPRDVRGDLLVGQAALGREEAARALEEAHRALARLVANGRRVLSPRILERAVAPTVVAEEAFVLRLVRGLDPVPRALRLLRDDELALVEVLDRGRRLPLVVRDMCTRPQCVRHTAADRA